MLYTCRLAYTFGRSRDRTETFPQVSALPRKFMVTNSRNAPKPRLRSQRSAAGRPRHWAFVARAHAGHDIPASAAVAHQRSAKPTTLDLPPARWWSPHKVDRVEQRGLAGAYGPRSNQIFPENPKPKTRASHAKPSTYAPPIRRGSRSLRSPLPLFARTQTRSRSLACSGGTVGVECGEHGEQGGYLGVVIAKSRVRGPRGGLSACAGHNKARGSAPAIGHSFTVAL